MDKADNDSYFNHIIFNITKKENRLVRLSNTLKKNYFKPKVFKFDCYTIQQKCSLSEEFTLTRRDLGVVLDCLNDFLLQFEAARQSNCYSLPTPKAPIGYTFLKDDLFCHHIHEIIEHSKRHIRLSFRLELNKDWIFSLEKFTLTGSKFLLEEIIYLRHSEVKSLLSIQKLIRSTCFLTWNLLQFWLVDHIPQQKFFLQNSFIYRIWFSVCLNSKQLSLSDFSISLPNLTQHDFFRVEKQHELISGIWTRYCLARSAKFRGRGSSEFNWDSISCVDSTRKSNTAIFGGCN